jgi:hypothetical protein
VIEKIEVGMNATTAAESMSSAAAPGSGTVLQHS